MDHIQHRILDRALPDRFTILFFILFLFALLCVHLLLNQSYRIGQLLFLPLERRFQRAEITSPERLAELIVLTGGDKRLAEAGRLARRYLHLKVVISGAKGMSGVPAELGGGIEPSRVVLEIRSSNTYENALYATQLIKPRPGARWLLVTGASHMPRALGSFRKVGFELEPWPVYDINLHNPELVNIALREWCGLLAYRLLGRTKALLPAE